jgi:hypothetical protein
MFGSDTELDNMSNDQLRVDRDVFNMIRTIKIRKKLPSYNLVIRWMFSRLGDGAKKEAKTVADFLDIKSIQFDEEEFEMRHGRSRCAGVGTPLPETPTDFDDQANK